MAERPTGTVTFLFTDIEGSTRLWEQHPEVMEAALARHDALAADLIQQHAGRVIKHRGEGDSLFAVFARATDAVAAASALQRALHAEPWSADTPLRVRMALHTGEAAVREGDYLGPAVNRCARLRAVAHGGQVVLSQATADLLRVQLPEETPLRDLGTHRLKDLQRPEHLFQLLHPELPADFPPLRSLEGFAHNLPAQLTSFIGRGKAMAEVKEHLSTTRLLTLTGSGGCGKTRLALQVAADLLEEYAEGVWLVELAPLADPALVPQRVASTLGLREEPGRPLTATLTDYLRPKSLLLVLDNCEHLLAACAQLADTLLRSCPSLRMLTSSREGLGIAGERTYRVPSLSLPPMVKSGNLRVESSGTVSGQPLSALSTLMQYEGVLLFVDRAVFTQPSFAVTEQNAPALAHVCQRLDGIPLAIELAAARVKALPVEKLNERLDDMFRLLTGGSRTALPRQQTLRALIDWSYDLLSPSERVLFRRLSVFAGSWTLEAAEAVGVGEGIEEWEVLDLLTGLVEKSLVFYEERSGEGRYRLLETVRQYARDRLLEVGEAPSVRERHRDWFLALAEQAEPELRGPEQMVWLERLEREHDNVRAALTWCLRAVDSGQGLVDSSTESGSQPDPSLPALTTNHQPLSTAVEAGLRLGGALWRFWYVRGYLGEGRKHLAELLALPGAEARTVGRARALCGAGRLACDQGDHAAAQALQEESLAISRELGNKRDIAFSLMGLGIATRLHRDNERARALHEEGLAIFRELGDMWGVAASLTNLGQMVNHREDCEGARALEEESLAIRRSLGDRRGIAGSLSSLGHLAYVQGQYLESRALHEESLAIHRELGDKGGIASSFNNLGMIARLQGDYSEALALHEQGLAIVRELGNKQGIGFALSNLGCVAHCQRDYGRAWALQEESLANFRELGNKGFVAIPLTHLGTLACLQGDYEQARAFFKESLPILQEVGDKPRIASNLEWLAVVAVAQAQPERAARLFGAAEALRETIGTQPPTDRAEHDRTVAAIRTFLGEKAFAAVWAEGRAMTSEEAVQYALEC